MKNTGSLLLLLLCLPVAADDLDAPGRPLFIDSETQTLYSTPAKSFTDSAPQDFELISDSHSFNNSQLPRVGDTRPQLLRRTYNPELGVYVDNTVPASRCPNDCEPVDSDAESQAPATE